MPDRQVRLSSFRARQTCKTTLLQHLVENEEACLINLQDRRLRRRFETDTGLLLRELEARPEIRTVIIDEIQKVPALLDDVQLLYDRGAGQRRFLLTGSSSRQLSKDKVLMGAERKSMILSEEEKKNTAYHEAGHALVASTVPYADPLHKVTIIPRGMALGVTMQLPLDDKHTYTRDYLESQLAIMMGGRAAEEIFLNHITTGAGNDIEQATEISRRMVCEWGMSDLGPLAYGKHQQEIFLGRDLTTSRDFSEDTAIKIDQEVKNFVNTAYLKAKDVITTHRDALVRIAEALLVREVLDASEVNLLIEGKPLPEVARHAPAKPSPPETTQVLKPQPAPGLPSRERPQPA